MERTRAKIVRNSEQLKEECDAVQLLLTTILDKNKDAVKDIGNLTEKEMLCNKKYFLNIIEFQDLAIQKLLSIGMDIDEFTRRINSHNLENVGQSICKSELSLSAASYDISNLSCKSCTPGTPTTEEIYKPVFTTSTHENISRKTSATNSEENSITTVLLSDINELSYKRQSSVEESRKSIGPDNVKSESDIVVDIIDNTNYDSPKHGTKRHNDLINSQLIDLSNASESIAVPSNKEIVTENNCSDSLSESNGDGSKKSSADISSPDVSEKVNAKKMTIQEKLKSKKLMTRRDRYLQNIQRPDMPDLSFRPSTKTFDTIESYVTCPESSSSTSVTKETERRKKKKRSINIPENENNVVMYKEAPEPVNNMLCIISRLVSPSEFYINYSNDNVSEIDMLSLQIAEIFKETSSPFLDKKTAMERLGDNCVCYLDIYECWYRVTVTNWRLKAKNYQEDQVTVYLVDYGHTCSTTYRNLREISEEFCHIPKCAIKCHLAWLYPPGSTEDNLRDIWPRKSVEYFVELFPQNDPCQYKVVYVEKCGDSWGIDLVTEDGTDDTYTFGQLLIDNELAVEVVYDPDIIFKHDFCLKQLQTAQGLAGITRGMCDGEKLERYHENIGEKEHDNMEQAMLRYKANDEARTCKHARNGTCFKGKRCKLDHGKLRQDGYTTDKQCIYVSAFKLLEIPPVGSTVKLRITNVVTVNTFYACLMNSQIEGLKNLIDTMNKRDTVAKYKPLKIIPTRSEMVIAKNWNNHWYRAKISDEWHYPNKAEETIKVFLVDLGEVVDVALSDLREITRDFLHLPFQAINCRLANVQPKENQDAAEAKLYCEKHFLSQIFNAEILYSTQTAEPLLQVLLKKHNSEDLGEQIIEDGYGELQTRRDFPAENLLID